VSSNMTCQLILLGDFILLKGVFTADLTYVPDIRKCSFNVALLNVFN